MENLWEKLVRRISFFRDVSAGRLYRSFCDFSWRQWAVVLAMIAGIMVGETFIINGMIAAQEEEPKIEFYIEGKKYESLESYRRRQLSNTLEDVPLSHSEADSFELNAQQREREETDSSTLGKSSGVIVVNELTKEEIEKLLPQLSGSEGEMTIPSSADGGGTIDPGTIQEMEEMLKEMPLKDFPEATVDPAKVKVITIDHQPASVRTVEGKAPEEN